MWDEAINPQSSPAPWCAFSSKPLCSRSLKTFPNSSTNQGPRAHGNISHSIHNILQKYDILFWASNICNWSIKKPREERISYPEWGLLLRDEYTEIETIQGDGLVTERSRGNAWCLRKVVRITVLDKHPLHVAPKKKKVLEKSYSKALFPR